MNLLPISRLLGPQNREPELSLLRAVEDLKAKTAVHNRSWRMDGASWSADLEAGTIDFTNERGWRITAPVQVIGTFNTKDATWLWGWDHPSVAPPIAQHASIVRAFGEKYRLERYMTRKIESSEAEAWQFTALACYLAGAQGGYRGPAGSTMVFMTFGGITIEKG